MNESFEKWWWDYDNGGLHCYDDCKAAHTAGLLRAAEIANSMTIDCPSDKCPQYVDVDDCMYKETGFCIAAAIRKEVGE